MSASQYTPGFGSKVFYAPSVSGAAGTYVEISQTRDIKGPDSDVGDIKVTNNSSPNNTREYGPGLIEPGTIGWEVVYKDTAYTTLMTMLGDGAIYWWKEVFTDGSTIVGPGYLKKAPLVSKTEDEAIVINVEVKLSGKAVWTDGS
jgi:hypothetical protein